jgi:hypothetical protein
VLPLLALLLIPLAAMQWNAMRSDMSATGEKIDAQGSKITGLERDVTTINTKLDAGLIWRLTQLERRFEAMEARVERREAQRHRP